MRKLLFSFFLVAAFPAAQAQDFTQAPPLPDFPQFYQTTEYPIRVDLVADGLANPWSIAFCLMATCWSRKGQDACD